MSILYVIIKYITVPGTYMKAFFEHITLRIYEVLIEDGRYLRVNEMCGHIEHEFVKRRGTAFGICFFPFLFNLIIGLVFTAVGSLNVLYLGEFFSTSGNVKIFNFVFLWLGISLLTNIFPQIEDAITLKELIYCKDTNLFIKIIAAPIFAILYCGAYLEKWGVTILTSTAFAFVTPLIINSFLPQFVDMIVG